MSANEPTLAELLDHDPVLLAAAYAPVNMMIDHLWSDHERYMRERFADVYELGDRLIREDELAKRKPQAGPIAAELNEESKRD